MKSTLWILSIVVALSSGLIFYFLGRTEIMRRWENISYDFRMRMRGVEKCSKDIVMCDIDDDTLAHLKSFPIPRDNYARALNNLKSAKAVVFDIVFLEPGEKKFEFDKWQKFVNKSSEKPDLDQWLTPDDFQQYFRDDDALLGNAIAEQGRVFMAYFFGKDWINREACRQEKISRFDEGVQIPYNSIPMKPIHDKCALDASGFKPNQLNLLPYAENPIPPIKAITENSFRFGFIKVWPDEDGIVRRYPVLMRTDSYLYPSIGLSVMLERLGVTMKDVTMPSNQQLSIKKRDGGTLDIPLDQQGQMLLHWYGPWSETLQHIPFYKILENNEDARKQIEGKIVFIGLTATGTHDINPMPFEARYPMVGLHGNAVSAMIEGKFINKASTRLDLFVILLTALVTGLVVVAFERLWSILAAALLFVAFAFVNFMTFAKLGLWLNATGPILAMSVTFLVMLILRYRLSDRSRLMLRQTFQSYMTPSMLEHLLADPKRLQLGGSRRSATVLFLDLEGFTAASSTLSPEDVVQMVNRYLGSMTEVVFKYDGYLDKYMGDAVMAVFGIPGEMPDHATRACFAALECQEKIESINAENLVRGVTSLRARIGLSSGEMVAANIGSDRLKNYSVLGDVVNLGSRLESANKQFGTKILINEDAYLQAKDKIVARCLGAIEIRGKKERLNVYELLGKQEDCSDELKTLVAETNQCLELLLSGERQKASEIYERLVKKYPEDRVIRHILENCSPNKK